MKLFDTQHNALQGLHMLLRMSKVRVTRVTLRGKLLQHPDFPSLTALSDTLDELRVGNLVAQLSPHQLLEIPLPALVHLRSEGGFFAPVRTTTAGAVEWWHSKRGWQKDTLARFAGHWSGVALLIEPTAASGEPHYARNRRREVVESLRLPVVILSLLTCLSAWAWVFLGLPAHAPLYGSVLLLKLVGLLLSSLLVWHSLDANNPFLRGICQINSRTNCSALLHTAAARLFAWLSWAEVGLFYFGGGLLTLLLFRGKPTALYPLLWGMTVAALPYTGWSVYYQWRRARQWCVLCLAVQATLWLEFGTLLHFQSRPSWPMGVGWLEVGLLATGFAALPTVWTLLKPVFKNAIRAGSLHQSLQALKFDKTHLQALRQRTRFAPPLLAGMRAPTLGSLDAPHRLLVVTSPTCSACARVHVEIEELLTNLENVSCQFILAVSPQPGDVGRAVAGLLLSQPLARMPAALHEWFTASSPTAWLKKTKSLEPEQADQSDAQVALHQQWCAQAGVQATPTVFFDGIEVPRYYAIAEMKQVIGSLTTYPPV